MKESFIYPAIARDVLEREKERTEKREREKEEERRKGRRERERNKGKRFERVLAGAGQKRSGENRVARTRTQQRE